MQQQEQARRYVIRGRVQGVGYRWFVQQTAVSIKLRGWTRNLDNGDVEVYAVGSPGQLSDLSGMLWRGPRNAEVRGVDESEAAIEKVLSFRIVR